MAKKRGNVTITVPNVDVALLRKQRNYLLELPSNEHAEGLISLLDAMLDNAEGFNPLGLFTRRAS